VLLAGDGVDAYPDVFAALDAAEPAGPAFESPSATALVELATRHVACGEVLTPDEVQPLYLRDSDAALAWGSAR